MSHTAGRSRARRTAAYWSAACAALVLCVSPLAAQSEAGYRANINKIAVVPANGAELGRIVDVELRNGEWSYQVSRDGRLTYIPVDSVTAKDVPVPVKPPPPPAPPRITPILKSTAAEFRRRLGETGGMLEALVVTPQGVSAEWISIKCGAFDAEVLDLLMTIRKTQKASAPVTGSRSCGLQTRSFTLTGETFDLYRQEKIEDAAVLSAIK